MIEEIPFKDWKKLDDQGKKFAKNISKAIIQSIEPGDTYNAICCGLTQVLAVHTFRTKDPDFSDKVIEHYKHFLEQLGDK